MLKRCQSNPRAYGYLARANSILVESAHLRRDGTAPRRCDTRQQMRVVRRCKLCARELCLRCMKVPWNALKRQDARKRKESVPKTIGSFFVARDLPRAANQRIFGALQHHLRPREQRNDMPKRDVPRFPRPPRRGDGRYPFVGLVLSTIRFRPLSHASCTEVRCCCTYHRMNSSRAMCSHSWLPPLSLD